MIACPETVSFNRSGWTWHLRDSSVLDPWFDSFLDGRIAEPLHSSMGKDIFRIVSYGRPFIVRSYHPKRAFARLKSRMVPKAREEYESCLFLEDLAIPSMECLGWGRRGPESLAIFRELPNSLSAREFWFSNVEADEMNLRQAYLLELARFLLLVVSSGVYHPNFRLGRLAVSGDPFQFFIALPHGVEKPEIYEPEMKFQMLRCIAELRGEINAGEAAAMIMYTTLEEDALKAVDVWRRMIKLETEAVEASWPKRRAQITSCDQRFLVSTDTMLIRCGMDGMPLLDPEGLSPAIIAKFDRVDFNAKPEEAFRLWLLSCKLMLHRLRHRMPVLMETDSNGRPVALLFERHDGIAMSLAQPSIGEFKARCLLAGIRPEDLEDNLDVYSGKTEIADIRKLDFGI